MFPRIIKTEPTIISGIVTARPSLNALIYLREAIFAAIGIAYFSKKLITKFKYYHLFIILLIKYVFGIFFIISLISIKKYQKKKKISFFKIILYFFEKSISYFHFFIKFLNSLNYILFYIDIPAFIFILLFIKFFPLLEVLKKISILFKKDCCIKTALLYSYPNF